MVKIEIFVHGALCVSISGKCYMSLAVYNTSANRGACYQNCRRSYRVIDEGNGNEFVINNNIQRVLGFYSKGTVHQENIEKWERELKFGI